MKQSTEDQARALRAVLADSPLHHLRSVPAQA
jgi:hypothetical protein